MTGQVDLRVHDRVALDEIDLYTEVLSAVAASDKPLTHEELDRVLGVLPDPVLPDPVLPDHVLPDHVLPDPEPLTGAGT
jgi:hypothetical protein